VTAESAGEINILLAYHTGWTLKLRISDVLYVPDLGLNLLSCSRLAACGISSVFNHQGWDLIDRNDNDDVIAKANLVDDLYWIRGAKSVTTQETLHISSKNTKELQLWHNRLGHVNKDKISSMIRKQQLKIQWKSSENDTYADCSSVKQIRGPFKWHLDNAESAGEVVLPLRNCFACLLIWKYPRPGGERYLLTLVRVSGDPKAHTNYLSLAISTTEYQT
jgi:GAG-pre-integrase domain